MSVITIRIDDKTRRKMRALKSVNWSRVVREAILRRIELEERREASRRVDALAKRVKPVSGAELVRWIREDRGR